MKEFLVQANLSPIENHGSTLKTAEEKVLKSIEETLVLYREGKNDHTNREDLERFQANCLQKAWVDMKGERFIEPGESHEDQKNDWLIEWGDWFRSAVMNHPAESGERSRKEYFLHLFEENPAKAVMELDDLFMRTRQ